MKKNTGPMRWILPVLVAAIPVMWSGCTSTPKSDEEPAAEADQVAAEAAPQQEPEAADAGAPPARTLSPSGVVVLIEPFSAAYYAEMIRAIEAGLKPLSSIPAPIGPPARQLHDQR
jgi:hypothetical protein